MFYVLAVAGAALLFCFAKDIRSQYHYRRSIADRPPMKISVVSGSVVQTNKHYQSHGGGISATLHQEFWLSLEDKTEKRFSFTDTDMGIRRSHEIAVIYFGSEIVAVVNSTTKEWYPFLIPIDDAAPISRGKDFLRLAIPAIASVSLATAYFIFSTTPSLLLAAAICFVPPFLISWRLGLPQERKRARVRAERWESVQTTVNTLLR